MKTYLVTVRVGDETTYPLVPLDEEDYRSIKRALFPPQLAWKDESHNVIALPLGERDGVLVTPANVTSVEVHITED